MQQWGCHKVVSQLMMRATRKFRWSELKTATNGFSRGNLIDGGSTFNVYKVLQGVLKDGSIVAIKKSSINNPRTMHYYVKLLPLVSKLQHKNIVKFVGYFQEVLSTSVEQFFRHEKDQAKEEIGLIWVEEYVPNGSLEEIIHGSQDPQLDWSLIFRIIEGVAQGLHYLHKQRILHKDVKPSNILLDSNMNPVITDFSISKVLDDDVDEMDDCVEGTLGFAAPEYVATGIVSMKNDVYAFGTTLLLIVGSIRRCPVSYMDEIGRRRPINQCLRWAWKAWERIDEEFDPSLFDGSHQLTEMKRCVEVGLLCTQGNPADRPTMADVVEMLHGHKELPVAKKPAWFQEDDKHPLWLRWYMATKKMAAQVLSGR